jgi:hypothetical protein
MERRSDKLKALEMTLFKEMLKCGGVESCGIGSKPLRRINTFILLETR